MGGGGQSHGFTCRGSECRGGVEGSQHAEGHGHEVLVDLITAEGARERRERLHGYKRPRKEVSVVES